MAARGCSTRRLVPRYSAWTMAARVRGGVQPGRHPGGHRQRDRSGSTAARGCSTRRPAPSWPAWITAARCIAVAFSPDGTRVATGSGDGSARVFDAATGAEVCRRTTTARVAVAFSPDGTRVATGSGDSVRPRQRAGVRRATGAELCRLDHDGEVYAVAFSPDGTRVATGSADIIRRRRQRGRVRRGDWRRGMPPGPRRRRCMRWRSARTAPRWPPAAAPVRPRQRAGVRRVTGAELCRLDHGGRCRRWRSARTAPRWPPAAAMAARGCWSAAPAPTMPAGPRRSGVRGGVQPGRRPGGHRQRRSAAHGSSTPAPAPTVPAGPRRPVPRWRSARTAPGWPPAAAMAARGCSTR